MKSVLPNLLPFRRALATVSRVYSRVSSRYELKQSQLPIEVLFYLAQYLNIGAVRGIKRFHLR
jgi:hypothetical protein